MNDTFKVTLINPNYRTKLGGSENISSILPPLGLCYIASLLRRVSRNFYIDIIDMNAEDLSIEGVLGMIGVHKPDIIGITCTTPTINIVNQLAKAIKTLDINTRIVVGGPHPTSLPEEVMANAAIDYVVVGEGEETMLELCGAIHNDLPLSKIDGLVWRFLGQIIINKPRKLIKDINKLPFPAIDLLPLDKYKSAYSKNKSFANILTSRGCPGRCTYCNKKIFGYDVRMRSAESIYSEIKFLHDEYGYKEFHIVDDLFTQDRQRVVDFCNIIKKEGLKIDWKLGNGVRVGSIDFDLLKRMKEVGLYSISFGIESGDQSVLNRMKKGQTIQMCKDAVCFARELDLFVVGFFMLGNLGETEATMRATIDFAKSLPLDVAQFSILVPFPGTEVYDVIEREGKILEKDYSKYDNIDGKMLFEHGALTKDLVEKMHKLAYKEFYMRPSFIFKRLMRTKSWLELKNQLKGFTSILKVGKKNGK